LTIWHDWDSAHMEAITGQLDAYLEVHPDVKLDLLKPVDMRDALDASTSDEGRGPDIVVWTNDRIGELAVAGYIVPLDGYGVDRAFLERTYEPAAAQGVIWQDQIWALPQTQEGIALVYDREAIGDTELPQDLPGLLEAAAAYHEAHPDKYLVCNQGFGGLDAFHVAPVYLGFGVPSYVDEQGQAYLNTPEALEAGRWLADFSMVSPAEPSYEYCQAALVEGIVAMWWTGPWAIPGLEAARVDYGILPMGRPFVRLHTLMLTRNAVDQGSAEVAVDLMRFFTGPEVQQALTLANRTIPAQTAALRHPEVAGLAMVAGFGEALNEGVPLANAPFASAQWGPVGEASFAIWTGAQTPQAALQRAQTALQAAVSQMK
jgi:arabinogalactan oligomer/maltooligosaccharide transport system substrate-binding protein